MNPMREPRLPASGFWRYGETEVIRSETPEPRKVATASTFSRLAVGAASVVVIQTKGDCTPKEASQRKMSAMEALEVASVGEVTTVVMMATMMRHAPQKAAVDMRSTRRPVMSARKPPAMMAT
jgi:hypothetical protein